MKIIKGFDEKSYLIANPNIEKIIKKEGYSSVLEYFKHIGYKEIQDGTRKFHSAFKPFNEKLYLDSFPDIKNAVKKGMFKSAFEHFCLYGYKEILDGIRHWPKDEDSIKNKIENINNEKILIEGFDEKSYLEANPDVKDAIEKGLFKSATEHLEKFGLEEIKKGKRKFHSQYESFDEDFYVQEFPKIKEKIDNGEFKSAFEHFCKIGYREIINGNIIFSNQFKLQIDLFDSKNIAGWGYVKRDSSYEKFDIEIYKDKNLITKTRVNKFREDLKKQNIGDGRFGFHIIVPEKYSKDIYTSQYEIVIIYKGKRYKHISSYGYEFLKLSNIQRDAFTHTVNELYDVITDTLSKNDKLIPYLKRKPLENTIVNKIFKKSKINDQMSKYLEYAYYRYKMDKTFKIEQNQDALIDYIFWYIDGYSQIRKPLHTPISESEISLLNKYIKFSLANFKVTTFHLNTLFRENNTANLNEKLSNQDQYKLFVYDWITQCIEKNIEFAIPEDYKTLLIGSSDFWQNKEFGLNNFTEIIFNMNKEYHIFNLHNENERVLFFIYLILKIIKDKNMYLAYIPQKTIEKIIYNTFGKTNLLQNFIKSFNLIESNEEFSTMLEAFSYESIKNFLLINRFDLESCKNTTFYNGNRVESFRFSLPSNVEEFDIQVIGPFEKASGLGQATRLSADILEKAGYTVHRVDFDIDNPAPEGFNSIKSVSSLPKKAKINLIHLNAESLPLAIAYMPDVFSDAYNIGYFYWELNTPAKCHDLGMDLVDEIWVSTEYGVEQYKPFVDKPVVNVRMAYEEEEQVSKEEAREFLFKRYGLSSDLFVFLGTFDSFSFIQRKNPLGLLKAFQKAFQKEENVRLLIKTHNRHRVFDPVQIKIWEAIDNIVSSDNRIVLVNETFSYRDLLKFKKGADCYISLHRSEGWGFGMIEAMNLGLPIIATGYSGNLEFCNENNSWLVDYDEVFLSEDDYIFVIPGQKWAEPKIDSAAKAMREVFENQELRIQKAQNAKAYIQENFSIDAIAQRYKNRVNEIIRGLDK
ncbi:glycosyltransferase family 4 protein [Hydrogenimonas thermophila]|uniref:glycosyltransferase family 4 protein n=1 Tax=Hydrogenimonas thermophila TaxID=223786 RepID=UPI002937020E|nr:glycosyltransferase family 4 protein [Hydrogenimonas thermophila]WOE69445.1 glycosyltransferase family 4 protein [Hydrogenimonas thermophila]WOE71955.1 glycosyltransferase family 4 protein [Hydrogenimonas thermophila]